MAVSIVEMSTGPRMTAQLAEVTLTATPQPGDLIALLATSNATQNATPVGVAGCGATWERVPGTSIADGTTRTLDLWIGRGATSAGVIAANYPGFPAGGDGRRARAWLIRGAVSTVVGSAMVAPSGPSATLPAQTVPVGGLIIAAGYADTEAKAVSSTTPATGWTIDAGMELSTAGRWARSATRTPTATGAHSISATRAGLCAVNAVVLTPASTDPIAITGTVKATPAAPALTVAGTIPTVGTVQATAAAPTVTIAGEIAGITSGTVAATAPAPVVHVEGEPTGTDTASLGFAFGLRAHSAPTTFQTGPRLAFAFGLRAKQARDWGAPDGSTRPIPRVEIAHRDGTPVCTLTDATIGALTMGIGATVLDSWGFTVDNRGPKSNMVKPVALEAQLWRGNILMSKGPIGTGNDAGNRTTYPVSDPRWYLWQNRIIGRIPKLNLIRNGDFSAGLAYWRGGWDAGSAPEAAPKVSVVDEPESTSGKGLLIAGVDKVVTQKAALETAAVFAPNSATYISGGEAKVIAAAKDIPDGATVHIVGHTADNRINGDNGDGLLLSLNRARAARATLAAARPSLKFTLPSKLDTPNMTDTALGVAGRGRYEPVGPNRTEAQQQKNRRVEMLYTATVTATGHRQYEWQSQPIVHPKSARRPLEVIFAGRMRIVEWLGAPKDGWSMRIALMQGSTVIEEGTASMDEFDPLETWSDYNASVTVPADGKTYTLRYQIYPPAGSSIWTDLMLEPQEQLGYFDTDRATIVGNIVRHVQDTAFGHIDLGIKTRTPKCGLTTTKEYRFAQQWRTAAAIEQVTSLARGLDVDCKVTPSTATITTHFPRQGSASGLTLTHGNKAIVTDYKALPAARDSLASVVIAQAWGISSVRPQRVARNNKALGGTGLETVIDADAESPLGELQEVADSALRRSIHPLAAWEVTLDPARTSEVLDRASKGDTVLLVLPDEKVHALHRIVVMTWDPVTDGLTLQLAPEET